MHVVIVDGDISYPPTSGKRLRTLNLMLRLAPRHEITYVGRCQTGSGEVKPANEFLRDHGIEPVFVDDPLPRKKGYSFYGRLAANLFSAWPYSVASHQSERMRQALRACAARRKVDLWQIEWSAYLPALDALKNRPLLLSAHNVDTLIWQRYYETARGFARRLFLKEQWRKFARFEQWAFAQADRVLAVSNEDADLIHARFGQSGVEVVENGIDREFFATVRATKRDPHRILFLGALDWRPNLDAIDLLLDKIFPKLLAAEPKARLVVVGRNPPKSLRQRIALVPNVELHSDVPDVRPYLAECGVMAVPLRIGGGSRLKILEALACELPVVSTAVGAEGLCLRAGEHYDRAEEDTMADALVQTMRDPSRAQHQAAAARSLVLAKYDWDALAKKMECVWEEMCCAGLQRSEA